MDKNYRSFATNKEKRETYSSQIINDLGTQSEQIRKKMQELNKKTPEDIQKEYQYCLQLKRKKQQVQK